MNTLRVKHGNESIGVTYGKLPGYSNVMSTKEVLKQTAKGAANSTLGDIIYEKFVVQGEIVGIDFMIRRQNLFIRQRNYLRGETLYTLIATYYENSTLENRTDLLFNSFRFTPLE